MKATDFDFINDADGTCHLWYCNTPGVVLAYDSFSPESALWFCAEHWHEYEGEGVDLLTIVEDTRANKLPKTAGILYPFGYGAKGSKERLEQLMADETIRLIDIRFNPRSSMSWWNDFALQRTWQDRYTKLGAFLGNINYKGGPIKLVNPQVGVTQLLSILKKNNVILLCACAQYTTCHRRIVCELLKEQMPDMEVIQP